MLWMPDTDGNKQLNYREDELRKKESAFMKLARLRTVVTAVALWSAGSYATPRFVWGGSTQGASDSTPGSSLDFQVYRARIEPIFLKQREGGIMCYNCHSVLSTRLRLQPMSSGSTSW